MIIIKRFAPILIFLLTLPILSWGQQPFYKNYQVRDGLPSNNIYTVFQDSKGLIWLGSDAGIVKFDGQHFEKITTQHGLPDNDVFKFYEDQKERLWLMTYNGKIGYIEGEEIYSSKNLPYLGEVKLLRYLNGFHENPKGEITITSHSNEYAVLNPDTYVARKYTTQFEKGLLMGGWSMDEDRLGYISTDELGYIHHDTIRKIISLSFKTSLTKVIAHGDSLFLSRSSEVFLFNSSTQHIEKVYDVSEIETQIISIDFLKDELWVGTRKGVFVADEFGKFRPANFDFLKDKAVSSILIDNEGGFWFSTLQEGIFYLPSPKVIQYDEHNNMPSDRISSLRKDAKNNLWIGGDESNYSILSPDNKIRKFILPKIYEFGHRIVNIEHDLNGWTIVNGKFLFMLCNEQDTLYSLLSSTDMTIDDEGNLWNGMNRVLFFPKEKFKNFLVPRSKVSHAEAELRIGTININDYILKEVSVSRIEKNANNKVWAGSSDGLFWFQKKEDGTILQSSEPVIPHQIKYMVFNKKNNILTVATPQDGLYFIKDTSVVHHIPLEDKDGPVYITNFVYDDNGEIWVGSLSGLFHISADWKTVKNYSAVAGIGNEKINALEVVDNQLFIGKDYGLVKFPIELLDAQNKVYPRISLVDVKVNLDHFEERENIELEHYQNSISFSFKGLSYRDYGKIEYKCRLLGQSENWDTTYANSTFYKNLSPGHYTFEVKAINGQGYESIQAAQLHFFIQKPFWMTWWFWSLFILGISCWIYAIIKQRERKLKRRYEAQQKLIQAENEKLELNQKFQELKMHALRLQMNPHFIFNSLNTIKGYYGAEDIKTANAYIKKFAKLLRTNLEYSDEYIPLNKEIEMLTIYVELSQMRYPNKFELEVDVATNISTMEIIIPPMLIQPFVENAIIHGLIPKASRGKLFLSFSLKNEILRVVIEDDGIGRKASAKINKNKEHKSLAINITRDRLSMESKQQLQEGIIIEDLENQKHEPKGTKTTLFIPIKKLW